MKPAWNPWPVGLSLALLTVFFGVVAFSLFAQRHRVDLVTPDYYEAEIAYQAQIDRQQRSQELASRPSWHLDHARGLATLDFGATGEAPTRGTIELYRPSDSTLDQVIPLELDAESRQEVSIVDLTPGLWIARLHWTAGGEEYFHQERWEVPEAPTSP